MILELIFTILAIIIVACLVWLKSKLPAVDNKTAQLLQYLELYNDEANPSTEAATSRRLEHYKELVESYYNLTTDLLHIIWGPHYSTGLVFPNTFTKTYQSYAEGQQMYQCYLALALQANDSMTLGDFGCGICGPTRCIAQFSGAKIKAVNITKRHLREAAILNKKAGLDQHIELINEDYHHTTIEDNSLDGVYMCESLGHSPDYKLLCREVFRVLKPGARFTGFNWDLTDNFDANNPEHVHVRFCIERGVGMPRMWKMADLTVALKEAGFEILVQRDHNDFGVNLGAKPWYFLLEERNQRTSILGPLFSVVSMSTKLIFGGVWFLEKLHFISPGTSEAYKTIMVSLRDGMVQGIKMQLFTPMHFWLAVKPTQELPN